MLAPLTQTQEDEVARFAKKLAHLDGAVALLATRLGADEGVPACGRHDCERCDSLERD